MRQNTPNDLREDLLTQLGSQIGKINDADAIADNNNGTTRACDEFVRLFKELGDVNMLSEK
jgi:hypothetical protein